MTSGKKGERKNVCHQYYRNSFNVTSCVVCCCSIIQLPALVSGLILKGSSSKALGGQDYGSRRMGDVPAFVKNFTGK